jgi:hypothetical protein
MDDLLATVVIYYLSDSFHTSVMIYNQSATAVGSMYAGEGVWGKIKSTIGYSAFVSPSFLGFIRHARHKTLSLNVNLVPKPYELG